MPRSQTITASNDVPVKADVEVRRAETVRLTLTPAGTPMALTVSLTPGGAPILEIPSEPIGSFFILSPAKVSVLEEGRKYQMNIWNIENPDEPLLMVTGSFSTSNTIQPSYVEYATQYFEDGSTVVLVPTLADLDDIVQQPGVIYAVLED